MKCASGKEMRVVLDSNVLISAVVYPRGRVAPLWEAAIAQRYEVLISPFIVLEVSRILRNVFHWEEKRVKRLQQDMARIGEIIVPRLTLCVIAADPTDDRILECAIAGKADLIVSGDRHLLQLKLYESIPIIRPIDFLRILGSK